MTEPIHLDEDDYPKSFPLGLDSFPSPVNDEHFIDAWLFNNLFSSLEATEQYLIDHRINIEAPLGDDVLGEEGSLLIAIPPARYPSYKFSMAWDSNLIAENILKDVMIFGILGTAEAIPPVGDTFRYYKVIWSSNWGDSLVGMSSIWLCDAGGTKQNDETMPHWSSANIINGTPPELSNTNIYDYFQLTTAYPGWWEVDLGTSQKIILLKTQSYIYGADRGFKDFILYGSNDRITYSPIYAGLTAHDATLQTFNLP